jgi:hypothetical protein
MSDKELEIDVVTAMGRFHIALKEAEEESSAIKIHNTKNALDELYDIYKQNQNGFTKVLRMRYQQTLTTWHASLPSRFRQPLSKTL